MTKLHYPIEDGGRITWIFGKKDCEIYANPTCEHMGTDFFKGEYSNIYAVMDGVVIESRDLCSGNESCGYGRRVTLQHEDGVRTLYAHLRERTVEVGDEVKSGDIVGLMGGALSDNCRGTSGGVHLHFEVILEDEPEDSHSVPKVNCGISNGFCVDPLPYLLSNYGETPQYKGNIIIPQGVNVRTCPSTNCNKLRSISYSSTIGIMELETDTYGNTWGRLLSFYDDEWIAVLYNGTWFAELEKVEQPEHPVDPPDPPPVSCESEIKAAEKIARIDEIDRMIKILEERRDYILWDAE